MPLDVIHPRIIAQSHSNICPVEIEWVANRLGGGVGGGDRELRFEHREPAPLAAVIGDLINEGRGLATVSLKIKFVPIVSFPVVNTSHYHATEYLVIDPGKRAAHADFH